MGQEVAETALAPLAPPGLALVRIDRADGTPALRVKKRWPLLPLAASLLPFGALTVLPVVVTFLMVAAWVAVWSSGWLDLGGVTLDAAGVTSGGMTIPFERIERCEITGKLRAKLSLVLRDGQRVRVFFGTHRQAAWIARTIEDRVRGGGLPLALPPARALPPRR